jgi:sRNA-binding regulator protein Hfq
LYRKESSVSNRYENDTKRETKNIKIFILNDLILY